MGQQVHDFMTQGFLGVAPTKSGFRYRSIPSLEWMPTKARYHSLLLIGVGKYEFIQFPWYMGKNKRKACILNST